MRIQQNMQRGFTFIELLVVFVLVAMLLGFVTISSRNTTQSASLSGAFDQLLTDISVAQEKAMSGEDSGTVQNSFGVRLETTRYILFRGSSYNIASTTNSIISLPETVELANITLPNSSIVFATGSGEVIGYDSAKDTFTLQSTNNSDQKNIEFNRYGIITSVN